jgi:integrase
VTVDRQLVTVQGRAPELAPPKTRASNRTIPLPRSVFGHKWRTAVKAVGLPAGTGFHALRHYYASLLIRHGESVKTVQSTSRPRQRGRDAGHLQPSVARF